jgi:hypothetical protein
MKCSVNLTPAQANNASYVCQADVRSQVQTCVHSLCDCSISPAADADYDRVCGNPVRTTYPCSLSTISTVRTTTTPPTKTTSTPSTPGTAPTSSCTAGYPVCGRPRCGGFAGLDCPAPSLICVTDPNEPKYCADCFGVCVPPYPTCGGIRGVLCPTGQVCVDDPRDSCNPASGGADCSGLCV